MMHEIHPMQIVSIESDTMICVDEAFEPPIAYGSHRYAFKELAKSTVPGHSIFSFPI